MARMAMAVVSLPASLCRAPDQFRSHVERGSVNKGGTYTLLDKWFIRSRR